MLEAALFVLPGFILYAIASRRSLADNGETYWHFLLSCLVSSIIIFLLVLSLLQWAFIPAHTLLENKTFVLFFKMFRYSCDAKCFLFNLEIYSLLFSIIFGLLFRYDVRGSVPQIIKPKWLYDFVRTLLLSRRLVRRKYLLRFLRYSPFYYSLVLPVISPVILLCVFFALFISLINLLISFVFKILKFYLSILSTIHLSQISVEIRRVRELCDQRVWTMVTLDCGKVYIGSIDSYDTKENKKSDNVLVLFPLLSGYRDEKQELHLTTAYESLLTESIDSPYITKIMIYKKDIKILSNFNLFKAIKFHSEDGSLHLTKSCQAIIEKLTL